MKRTLLTAAILLVASQSALFADIYTVNIDTASILGPGYIDIQFNPAPGSSAGNYQLGSAIITGFQGAAVGAEEVLFRVSATGDLVPGPLTITNEDFTLPNGVYYEAVFGSSIQFQLELLGPAYTAVGESLLTDFSISLYGASGAITGRATLLGGSAIDASLSDPQVTFSPLQAVPEPSAWLLWSFAPGVAMVLVRHRRRAPVTAV